MGYKTVVGNVPYDGQAGFVLFKDFPVTPAGAVKVTGEHCYREQGLRFSAGQTGSAVFNGYESVKGRA